MAYDWQKSENSQVRASSGEICTELRNNPTSVSETFPKCLCVPPPDRVTPKGNLLHFSDCTMVWHKAEMRQRPHPWVLGSKPKAWGKVAFHLAHLASCPCEKKGFTSVPRNWFQRTPIFETNGVERKVKRCWQLPILTDLAEVSLAHTSSIKWQYISCLQIETYLSNWGVEGQEGERFLEVTNLVNIIKGPVRVKRKYKIMFPILVGFYPGSIPRTSNLPLEWV